MTGSECATRERYALALLTRLSEPTTARNQQSLVAWMLKENGGWGHAAYNPLNTTMSMSGASNYNSVHVKNYASCSSGIDATVDTLRLSIYNDIRAHLAASAPIQHLAGLRVWGTGDFADAYMTRAAHEMAS